MCLFLQITLCKCISLNGKNCIADLVFISFYHYKVYVYLELGKQIVNKVFFCLVVPRYIEINEVSIGVSFSEELRNTLISSSNKLGKYLFIVLGTLEFRNKKNNFKFLTAYIAFAISLKNLYQHHCHKRSYKDV